mmetsp:Transcript_13414/g.29317  ORF Transcript_13414/g.29317 Transcript_13414/m.29317 type:complete len:358 (+) Transcript_13414:3-1076(+)
MEERDLVSEVGDLEARNKDAAAGLEFLSEHLAERGQLRIMLLRSKKDLERRCAESVARCETAQEVLELQAETEAHCAEVYSECRHLEIQLAEEHVWVGERKEQLAEEWLSEHAAFRHSEQELEAEIQELQRQYEERWEEAERRTRSIAETKEEQASEAYADLQLRLASLNNECEAEQSRREERLEEEQRVLALACSQATRELQGELQERQEVIQQKLDQEKVRFVRIRKRVAKSKDELVSEVGELKQNIQKLRENYRARDGSGYGGGECKLPPIAPPNAGGGGGGGTSWLHNSSQLSESGVPLLVEDSLSLQGLPLLPPTVSAIAGAVNQWPNALPWTAAPSPVLTSKDRSGTTSSK